MVNAQAFTERLEQLLAHYEMSASSFADAIGVQRSSISHLISGRNRPSLDFVMKVISRFPEVNLYWLLNGKGEFPPARGRGPLTPEAPPALPEAGGKLREIDRIVFCYSDGTFETYVPGADENTREGTL